MVHMDQPYNRHIKDLVYLSHYYVYIEDYLLHINNLEQISFFKKAEIKLHLPSYFI